MANHAMTEITRKPPTSDITSIYLRANVVFVLSVLELLEVEGLRVVLDGSSATVVVTAVP
jgi:hypothetical protein